jgi:hypothetical protein
MAGASSIVVKDERGATVPFDDGPKRPGVGSN